MVKPTPKHVYPLCFFAFVFTCVDVLSGLHPLRPERKLILVRRIFELFFFNICSVMMINRVVEDAV